MEASSASVFRQEAPNLSKIMCFLPKDGSTASFQKGSVLSFIYIYLLHDGRSPREEDCICICITCCVRLSVFYCMNISIHSGQYILKNFHPQSTMKVGQDSIVHIVTCYGLDGLGIECCWG